jgi:WD repeat and SOF domain-containing protein 1
MKFDLTPPLTFQNALWSQQKVFRNYDPALRSQEKAVEYTRALNAAKLEKVCHFFLARINICFFTFCWDNDFSPLLVQIFAKPFIGAMDGHLDAVSCMAKNPNHLKAIFSGSMDGGNYLFLNQLLSY